MKSKTKKFKQCFRTFRGRRKKNKLPPTRMADLVKHRSFEPDYRGLNRIMPAEDGWYYMEDDGSYTRTKSFKHLLKLLFCHNNIKDDNKFGKGQKNAKKQQKSKQWYQFWK